VEWPSQGKARSSTALTPARPSLLGADKGPGRPIWPRGARNTPGGVQTHIPNAAGVEDELLTRRNQSTSLKDGPGIRVVSLQRLFWTATIITKNFYVGRAIRSIDRALETSCWFVEVYDKLEYQSIRSEALKPSHNHIARAFLRRPKRTFLTLNGQTFRGKLLLH